MRVHPWHLALLATLIAGLAHALALAGPFEDAFITFRYAENWAGGSGLRFNPGGEAVEGFSSLSWVTLAAGAKSLGVDVPTFARHAGLLFAAALLGVAGFAGLRLSGARGLAIAFVPALVASSGTFGYWAGTGMETTLFAALIAAVVTGAGSHHRRGLIAAGACAALAIITRPEAIAYAVSIAGALALARRWRAALAVGVPAAVATAAVTAWRLAVFDDVLPNTFYAKAEPSAALWANGAAYVEAFMTSHLLWLVVPAAAVVLARRELRGPLAPALGAIAAAVASSVVAGGDTFAFYRFMLPAIAPIGLVLVAAAVVVSRTWSRRSRALGGALGAAALLGAALAAAHGDSWSISNKGRLDERALVDRAARFNGDYVAVGRFLREHFEPDTVIAINAAGIVPYVSGLETIDMLGLNDRHIAHRDIELGHGAAGHEKYDAAYVLSREPDVIIIGLPFLVDRPPADDAELRAHLAARSRHLPGDRALLASPELAEHYRPWAAPVDGRYLILLVRESPAPPERSEASLIDRGRLETLAEEPGAPQWFGVYLGERKIGHARLGLRASGAGEPSSIVAESSMSVRFAGEPERALRIDADRYYERQPPHRLVEVRSRETTADGVTTLRYVRRRRGMQVYRTVDGKQRRGRGTSASRETLETLVTQYLLEPGVVEVGDRVVLRELDIDSGRDRSVEVEVAARRSELIFGVPAEVAELAIRREGDRAVTRTLVAAGGKILRAEVGRFSFRAQDQRRAISEVEGYDHLASAIRVDRELGEPSAIRAMTAALISSTGVTPPAAANQQVSQDRDRTVVVITAAPGDPLTDEERAAALEPTPEIDAAAPAIQKLAGELIEGASDPRERVARLVRYVFENLTKQTSTNLASASQVLAAGVGDCTEHSLLFVALARAAGIAAREVSGLVWAGDDAGHFAWHAWAEVELEGHWHRVDPSWGETTANASHITLGVGDDAGWLALLGDLRIEIGAVETAPQPLAP